MLLTDPAHRLRTPVGTFMHAIVAANAEFYSANLAAEAEEGTGQKGEMGGTPTRRPSAT